jgi:hypothetical protein
MSSEIIVSSSFSWEILFPLLFLPRSSFINLQLCLGSLARAQPFIYLQKKFFLALYISVLTLFRVSLFIYLFIEFVTIPKITLTKITM